MALITSFNHNVLLACADASIDQFANQFSAIPNTLLFISSLRPVADGQLNQGLRGKLDCARSKILKACMPGAPKLVDLSTIQITANRSILYKAECQLCENQL
jgi:hypothetical protein